MQKNHSIVKYVIKAILTKVLSIHDESKEFKCDVCLKLFCNKRELKRHYRTHTGEKPFACPICDKRFSQKSNLAKHQATHSEIKAFKCSICPEGRYFKTKKYLNQHMIFRYEPTFSCIYCDHKSYTKGDLNKHVKRIHNKFYKFVL